jgi:hypothetical protein
LEAARRGLQIRTPPEDGWWYSFGRGFGDNPHLEAIERPFGGDIDYAMLIKIYSAAQKASAAKPGDLHRGAQASS